jgi:class 3 adenylate cyclase
VLYAGIPEFADYSQQAPPDIVFEVLNGYLALAVTAILEEEGTLDRLAGDGVMALWNAPVPQADHALRAVRAAMSMDRAVKAHRSLLDYTYRLYFGVGVATGEVALGGIGAHQPPSYTAVGDTVDLARRLGSLAKPGQVLLSPAAFRAIADRVIARELPSSQLERAPSPATAYELLSDVF